jgi:hypothetical protein
MSMSKNGDTESGEAACYAKRGVDEHQGPFCMTCDYAFFRGTEYAPQTNPKAKYECRHKSPSISKRDGPLWPMVDESHWCGCHPKFKQHNDQVNRPDKER